MRLRRESGRKRKVERSSDVLITVIRERERERERERQTKRERERERERT